MIIYFHIDEFARDSIVASSLRKEFLKNNDKLIYGNRLTTKFLLPLFYNFFDCIIVPRASFLKKNKKINSTHVVVLPNESIGRINSSKEYILYNTFGEKFMLGDTSEYDFVSMYLLWGYLQKNIIEEYLPSASSKVHVVGHPRLDKNCTRINKNNKIKDKLKIGIVSRMTHANSYDNRTILKHFQIFKNEKYIYYKNEKENLNNEFFNGLKDYIYQELSDFNVYYTIIIKLLENPNIEIYFKVHPRENVLVWNNFFSSQKNNGNFHITDWNKPFVHWCQNLDYLISTSSTSFYEAVSLNTKIICIDEIDPFRKLHDIEPSEKTFGLSKYLKLPKSIEDIEQIIYSEDKHLIQNQDQLNSQLKSEIDFPNCFFSSGSIVKIIRYNISERRRALTSLYTISSNFVNYSIFLKRLLTFRIQFQSNNFLLTSKNIKFINKLID